MQEDEGQGKKKGKREEKSERKWQV